MNCSGTLREPKNKFHSCNNQFFTHADTENGKCPWNIHATPDPYKVNKRSSGSFAQPLPHNFLLRLQKFHRHSAYRVNAIILNHAK
jgi:hypothetical protein